MSQRPHIAAERAAWQAQLIADPEVTLVPLRVAIAISNHIHHESRDAWPSQARLSQLTGAHRGNVAHAIRTLVKLGHLSVEKDGRGNRYRPISRVLPNAQIPSTCFSPHAHQTSETCVPGEASPASPDTHHARVGTRTNIKELKSNLNQGRQGEGFQWKHSPSDLVLDDLAGALGRARHSERRAA